MTKISFLIITVSLAFASLTGQDKVGINIDNPAYTLDVRSLNINDAAQIQIAHPDNSGFLRLFSGNSMLPNPLIYFMIESLMYE